MSDKCFLIHPSGEKEEIPTGGGSISDGYHTFDELYEHRITIFIALCRYYERDRFDDVWRSKFHSDGTHYDGWFVLGLKQKPGEQITYHLPLARWHDCDFAETLERAPEYDGHTSADVIERLKEL